MDDLARQLALVLADRVTAGTGPALGVVGLRQAVRALEASGRPAREEHLLTALHSSSFQVRLSVALALIRRGPWELIERKATAWISEAESPQRTGVQHQLGLALWFCPHLAASDPSGSAADLFDRGLQLAAMDSSNPLMFEISLTRSFKLAAWARPDQAVDSRTVSLLKSQPRFWYSRVCLIHALGIRLASPAGKQPTAGECLLSGAEGVLVAAATADPHPLAREAARITRDNLAAGADAATFCWFSESRHGPVEFPAERSGDATAGRGEPAAQPHLLRRAVVGARVAATRHDQPAAGLPPPARPPRAAHGNQLPSATACSGCAHTRARRPGGAVGRLLPGPARRRGATRPAPWHEGRSIQPQVDFWLYAEQYLANKDGWEISL